jgi:hypothetical protein
MKKSQEEKIRNLSPKDKMKYLGKTDQDLINDLIMISFSKTFVSQMNLLKEDNIVFKQSIKAQTNTLLDNLDKTVKGYISRCSPESQVQFNVIEEELTKGFQRVILELHDIVKFVDSLEEVQENIKENE